MKKLISLSLLLFSAFFVKAQTADETLEWLRTKQLEIQVIHTGNLGRNIDDKVKLTISETSIKASDTNHTITIGWEKIKDVTNRYGDVTIVGDELIDGNNVFIKLRTSSSTGEKYAKALKHLANLKGAKMIKPDLF